MKFGILMLAFTMLMVASFSAHAQRTFTTKGATSVQNQGYSILEDKMDKAVAVLQGQVDDLKETLTKVKTCQASGLLFDFNSDSCTSIVHNDLREYVRRDLPNCGGSAYLTSNGEKFICKSAPSPKASGCSFRGVNYGIGETTCHPGGGRMKCTASGFVSTHGGGCK